MEKLTYNQFEVLRVIEKYKDKCTIEKLLKETSLSLEILTEIQKDLVQNNFIDNANKITELGLKKLEPYKVKNAIFLAAGYGERLLPVTLDTPKPMVKVNGIRIIETLLEAVISAEIEQIIIVVGHLSEQFKVLSNKYPNIKLIENKKYKIENNISSAYLIKDYIGNSYVFEADLVLYNKDIIRKYEYQSNFLCKYVTSTDDWCFEAKDGIITKQKVRGHKCYHMYGISYYTYNDGKKLRKDLEKVYKEQRKTQKYWEQVPLDICKDNYKIKIKECNKEDIIEIDTFDELKEVDKTYINFEKNY